MATANMGSKTSRIDIRMTGEQKRQIEAAASLNGLSVSQWSLGQLLASARDQILASSAVRLSAESFDRFAELLDGDADPTFEAFASEATIWER